MCGIVGYIGKRQAAPILLEGLHRMEYRGYDSAGLAVVSEKGAEFFREKGRVAALREKISGKDLWGVLGIAHTRWATHGVPSERNAHPHSDCRGEIFVVHNGIIENYQSLKDQLLKEGHKFTSDTDTEVLAHLIEKEYSRQNTEHSLAAAAQEALKQVTGAYGIAVVSSREPKTLVAARFGSPLIVGVAEGEYIVASDLTAILPVTSQVIYLEDGEMAAINHNDDNNYKLSISDLENHSKEKQYQKIDWTIDDAEKGGYEHFMLKEIFEQPQALVNSIRGRLIMEEGAVKLGGLERANGRIDNIERLIIVGMGTARNAGLVGEYMLEEYAELPVEVEFASEFAYKKSILTANPPTGGVAILAVSQSGETADTLMAIKEAKRKGALVLGIVNVTGSTIARETDAGVYNHIGPEIAVASTKAFLSQVTILALLSIYFGRKKEMSLVTGQRIVKEIQDLPAQIDAILDTADAIKSIAEKYKDSNHFFFI